MWPSFTLTLPLLQEKDVEGCSVHRVTTLTGNNPEDVQQLIHMKANHMVTWLYQACLPLYGTKTTSGILYWSTISWELLGALNNNNINIT